MVLTLEVTSSQAASLGRASRRVFRSEGGIIGRQSDSNWVLPDPGVSRRHAIISFRRDTFYIEDAESTGGVYVNGAARRLPRGQPYALKSGDRLRIDPYDIAVSIASDEDRESDAPAGWSSAPRRSPAAVEPRAASFDPFGLDESGPQPKRGRAPHRRLDVQEPPAEHAEELDPLRLLDAGAKPVPVRDEPVARPQPARVTPPVPLIPADYDPLADLMPSLPEPPPLAQARPAPPPPTPAPAATSLPESLLEDLGRSAEPLAADEVDSPPAPQMASTPAAPSHPEARKTPPAPTPVPDIARVAPPPPVEPQHAPAAETPRVPKPHAATPPEPGPAPAASDESSWAALLEGAGLDPNAVTPEVARDFGRILRVVVEGVMDVLQARHQTKDEFQLRMTHLRPIANNPLKFSANVDDALFNLLVKRNPAYLGAIDAFEDAFDDLRHHQIATFAGMRVAFEAMLAEFDPARLQERFDKQGQGSALAGLTAKYRYWGQYCDAVRQLASDPEESFRRLFGDEFAKAYEEQMDRLKAASRQDDGEPDVPD
jgi:predicted component of type VI protein secretion system